MGEVELEVELDVEPEVGEWPIQVEEEVMGFSGG